MIDIPTKKDKGGKKKKKDGKVVKDKKLERIKRTRSVSSIEIDRSLYGVRTKDDVFGSVRILPSMDEKLKRTKSLSEKYDKLKSKNQNQKKKLMI